MPLRYDKPPVSSTLSTPAPNLPELKDVALNHGQRREFQSGGSRSSMPAINSAKLRPRLRASLHNVRMRTSFSPRSMAPVNARPRPLSRARSSCDQPRCRRRDRTRSPSFRRTLIGSCIPIRMRVNSCLVNTQSWDTRLSVTILSVTRLSVKQMASAGSWSTILEGN